MQTFRDCERELLVAIDGTTLTCAEPQIFADYLCGIGPSTAPQMKSGASRAILFAGGYLQVRYNAALIHSSDVPCRGNISVVTALVVLPLLEDDLTPAYLPNLVVARSQLSVVPATESDTDENILFWRKEQLDVFNVTCIGKDDEDCTLSDCMQNTFGTATSLWGRSSYETRVKARRRIKEREALFLMTEFTASMSGSSDFPWPVHRNVYMRYAVR